MSGDTAEPKAGLRSYALSTLSIGVILIAWESVARAKLVPELFLPSVSAVLLALRDGIADRSLPIDLGVSLFRAFAGLLIASVVGVAAGIAMARSALIRWFLDPFVSLAFPAPKIAFLPIFVLWFGIDHLSKVLLVAFSSVFPILNRDLQRGYFGQPSSDLVVAFARQFAAHDHVARHSSGMLSANFCGFPRSGARRVDYRVHGRNGGGRWRHGCSPDVLAALFREPDRFCLHSHHAGGRVGARQGDACDTRSVSFLA